MRMAILRSGSSGNCTLIEHESSRILIDAGMSQKRIKEVLEEVDLEPDKIQAIVVTHLHSDHCNYSTIQICRKFGIKLYIHASNFSALNSVYKKDPTVEINICCFKDQSFQIGSLIIEPFDVSHDAFAVTSGFIIKPDNGNEKTLCYAADLGFFPDTLISKFQDSKIIVLESNHDVDLLWKNPNRPYIHKKRVAGDKGHLSNMQSAEALAKIAQISKIKPDNVILCHLSQDHNSPQLALDSVSKFLEKQSVSLPLCVAHRNQRTQFFEI